jgi:hypothetical protein
VAWRIHDSIVHGEIDNRQRGVVRGRVWLKGHTDPVLLDLKGNAAPDLAGCLLTFENPGEPIPMRTDGHMAPIQHGTIGDLTASRKVRVFDIPFEEARMLLKKKLPVPEHMANCLYLEWFSDANGRVVIESTDYKLTISPPAWRLTPEEEKSRAQEAAAGFNGFIQRLSDALASKKHQPPENKEWDEFDYEKFMRECDARTDKYGELLDKYMDHPDRDRIIAREMGWTWLEEALDAKKENEEASSVAPATPAAGDLKPSADDSSEGDDADKGFDFPDDIPELEPNPATEGVDWVRGKDGYICHPLCLRTLEGSLALWHKLEELGLDKTEDDDLCSLLGEYQTTSAKLAGALDGLAYDRDLSDGPFIVACLKRALSHLQKAQGALEKVAPKNLLPADMIPPLRAELFAVREEILRLMEEFRSKH